MKRITIDKNDSVAAVVERVIASTEQDIVLVVPREAAFKKSQENFDLLKREAAAAGKALRVESVDSEALSLAEASGLGATHPLFAGSSRSLSDIIPAGKAISTPARKTAAAKTGVRSMAKAAGVAHKLSVPSDAEEGEEEKEEIVPVARATPAARLGVAPEPTEEDSEDEDDGADGSNDGASALSRRSRDGRRALLLACGAGALLLFGAWAIGAMFGRTDVAIAFKKTPWSLDAAVSGTKTATVPDHATKTLPVEVFRTTKTTTQLLLASGRATVSDKARGRIIVYNAYSSAPQPLVATTRFVTPDGKVFRLEKTITVPGAAIKDSKIVPASIEAEVIADKPGAEYNFGAVAKLTVPGFEKTPAKYEGFYGSLVSTSGGFVGERAVPTEQDIATAKSKITEVLLASLKNEAAPSRPEGFIVPDGASATSVTKITVNARTDDQNNFSVFGEAELREIGFRERDLRDMLSGIAGEGNDHLALTGLTLHYRDAKPDFGKGTLTVTVAAAGTLTTAFSEGTFRETIAGKPVAEARAAVSGLYGLTKAEVNLKPFWLGTLPANPNRIHITLE